MENEEELEKIIKEVNTSPTDEKQAPKPPITPKRKRTFEWIRKCVSFWDPEVRFFFEIFWAAIPFCSPGSTPLFAKSDDSFFLSRQHGGNSI